MPYFEKMFRIHFNGDNKTCPNLYVGDLSKAR